MIKKNKPPLVESVKDENGKHSHFILKNQETGNILWRESKCDECKWFNEDCQEPYADDCEEWERIK